MTDRELLELAAKAAGIDIFDWTPGGHPTANGSWDGIWNPLTDDGDALRLAVDLKIGIGFKPSPYADVPTGRRTAGLRLFEAGADELQNTRRAIVRAAAEIGRTTQ